MIITSAGQIYLRVAFSREESRLKKNHADMHNGGGRSLLCYFVSLSYLHAFCIRIFNLFFLYLITSFSATCRHLKKPHGLFLLWHRSSQSSFGLPNQVTLQYLFLLGEVVLPAAGHDSSTWWVPAADPLSAGSLTRGCPIHRAGGVGNSMLLWQRLNNPGSEAVRNDT